MTEISKYPPQPDAKKVTIEDPVARSMARPDACAKPCTVGKVRVRTTLAAKAPKRGRRKGKRDPRDIKFFGP